MTTPICLWRRLLGADQASEEFPELAIKTLNVQERSTIDLSGFTENEVTRLIELIDSKVLRHQGIPKRLKNTAFFILRRLCGTFQRLPNSCLVHRELRIDDGMPFAARTRADLWKGEWRNERVGVKLLRFSTDDDRVGVTKRFCEGVVLWKQLSHHNLLPFYGACAVDQPGVVFPWLENGNIIDFTRRNPEVNRLRLLIDAANGLEYLHGVGVTHGDLRGTNVLITGSRPPRAVLSDLGFMSITFDPLASVNWTAPELLSGGGRKPSLTSDVYAFAMVIYEVLTCARPFTKKQGTELAYKIVLTNERPPRPGNSESLGFTKEIWNLLESCWSRDVSSRPTAKRVVNRLEGAAKGWTANPAAFLAGSDAAVLEMMGCKKAQWLADELDKALDHVGVSVHTKKYLRCLRKLCGASGVLPRSFALDGKLLENVDNVPFARGGFSDVYHAMYKGQRVVVKALRIDLRRENRADAILAKEVVGWKWLRHDNVLQFVGVTSIPQPYCIVSLWMENGNVMNFLKSHREHNPFSLLVDVTIGLQYLHDHDFVHGDLKGANILVDSDNRARLADFGLARIVDDPYNRDTSDSQKMGGTVRWSAPEYLDPEKFGFGRGSQKRLPSKSTDTYALGMTILEVITQRRPFDHIDSVNTVLGHVVSGGQPERPPVGFSDALWELLEKSWVCEHASTSPGRPSISLFRIQLEQDGGNWVSMTGVPRALTLISEDTTPSTPINMPEKNLHTLLEQVQEFLHANRSVITHIPAVITTSSLLPIPVAGPFPALLRTPTKRHRVLRFLGGFKRFFARFSRQSREPGAEHEGSVKKINEPQFVELF